MMVTDPKMSLAHFLELSETEPASEYINGRILLRPASGLKHSRIQCRLSAEIDGWGNETNEGEPLLELRCTFSGRSLVFDVAYFRSDRIAFDPNDTVLNDVFLAPDLAIEILSPEQSIRSSEARLKWCIKNGVRLAWLIDPERRRAKVFRPGARPVALNENDALNGADVLPGFRLPLATIFGWLKRSR
jgi:Uma2 family endonuclease